MKRQTLLLVTLSALLLAACNNSYSNVKSSEINSVSSEETSSSSELPDAPLDQIFLTVEDFAYNEDISVPVIHGLESRGIRTNYTYLDANTEEYVDVYDAGTKNYIEIGTYILKADVTCFSYKPFTLTATFSVLIGEMDLSLVAHDYYYDEEIPNPWLYGEPYSAEVTYKYYSDPNNKLDFKYGVTNTIVPGEYTLEATVTDEHFKDASTTDTFTVFKAEFDYDYELQEDSIDLGQIDTGFSQSDIDLDNLLHIKNRNTDEEVAGVHFTFKEEYDFSGDDFIATVIAQKEHFEDQEYNICVSFTKTRVVMPHLECVNAEDDINNLVYDGTAKSVKLVDFDKARSNDNGVLTATEVSGYCVTVSLKDPLHTCWEDGTTEDLLLQWFVKPYTPVFRLRIGDYVGPENEKNLYVPYSTFAEPVDVSLECKESDSWVPYEYQELLPFDESYDFAHFDENNRLVIDNRDQIISVEFTSSNRNHSLGQCIFHIHNYETKQLDYTPTNHSAWWNDDAWPIAIDYCSCTAGVQYSDDFILEGSTNGDYFSFNASLLRVQSIKLAFNSVPNMLAFAVYCVFNDANGGVTPGFQKRVEVEEGYDGSFIELNVSDLYDLSKMQWYTIQIYFDGEETQTLQLNRVIVQYMRTV